MVYRQATASEIEYLSSRFGELRADELAQSLACARCPLATDCPIAYCPDRDCRHLAARGCPIPTPAMTAA